ncbi:hypothetical protein LTR85_008461 [Meristemomyces frigidus]|nr:hypothetical protein LTR85_008461 [Meristemomyces frigidus]
MSLTYVMESGTVSFETCDAHAVLGNYGLRSSLRTLRGNRPADIAAPEYTCAQLNLGGYLEYPCGGPGTVGGSGFQVGWGECLDSTRLKYSSPYLIPVGAVGDILLDCGLCYIPDVPQLLTCNANYNLYKQDYDAAAADPACRNVSSLGDCPPLAKTSEFEYGGKSFHLDTPMLDFRLFGTNASSGLPNVWMCEGVALKTVDFSIYGYATSHNVTGFCQAGNTYQWGFSFLLLFLVCILQVIFAAIMYALWIEARRNSYTAHRRVKRVFSNGRVERSSKYYPSVMGHTTNMIAQAERAYGDGIKAWSTTKLDKTVWRGRKGMRALQAYQQVGDQCCSEGHND